MGSHIRDPDGTSFLETLRNHDGTKTARSFERAVLVVWGTDYCENVPTGPLKSEILKSTTRSIHDVTRCVWVCRLVVAIACIL